jgi:ketosteroid isomerase-like protein
VSETVIDKYFRSVNTEDWDLMAEIWNEDGELLAVGFDPIKGKADVMAYYPKILSGYPEHVDTPTRVVWAGDTVLVEIDYVGTSKSGQRVTFSAVDVFDLVDGRITKLSTWYDSYGVVKQLRAGAAAG